MGGREGELSVVRRRDRAGVGWGREVGGGGDEI